MEASEKTRRAVVTGLMLIYLVSGACSLIDEVVWARLLKLSLGNTVYASSVVVSVFMAGLALGAFLMGRRCDGLTKPLRLYALIELAITAMALLSPWALRSADDAYRWLFRSWQPAGGGLIAGQVIAAASVLLMPTLLMGATLPLLGRVVASVEKDAGPLIGKLYALNTLGAAAGCFLAGFVLMRLVGVLGALRLAAGMNLLVALGGYAMYRVVSRTSSVRFEGGTVAMTSCPDPLPGRGNPLWLSRVGTGACPYSDIDKGGTASTRGGLAPLAAGCFLSGAVSIGYELLWMRSVVHSIGAFTFVFSSVLVIYLAGNVVGAMIGSRLARDARNPAAVFAGLLLALGVCGVLYLPWLNLCSYRLLPAILDSLNESSWSRRIGWNVVSPLLQSTILFLVPSVVMGVGFPVMLQAWVDRAHRLGRSTGTAYGTNTWGGVLGGLLTGFVLIPLLGVQAATAGLGLAAIWAGSALWLSCVRPVGQRRLRRCLLPLAAAWLTLLAVRLPGDLFRRTVALNRWMRDYEVLDIEEGLNTTVSLHRDPKRDVLYLCTSGRKVAGTSPGYRADQKMLGHLPVLLNRNARSVLSVGFGSGESTACLAAHDLERIDCAEIASEVVQFSLKYFSDINLGDRLDEKVNMIYQDARHYLHMSDRRYDVIVNDCTSIRGVADNASLYTKEYFEIARRHLHPHGLFMSWIDVHTTECSQVMRSVMGTFMEVFPHVTLWYMVTEPAPFFVIVGSEDPQVFSLRHVTNELARPAVARSLAGVQCRDSADVLSCYVADEDDLSRYVKPYATNSDYSPVVEFCMEDEPAGPYALREFFAIVRSRSIHEHLDWTGVRESEKVQWLERFARACDAATCVLMAESASDWLDRLRLGVAGLRSVPGHHALTLIRRNAEQVLLELGFERIRAGAADQALATAHAMHDTDPNSARAWVLRAQAELSIGDPAAAKVSARRALDIAPDDPGIQFNLWRMLVSANDPAGAAAVLHAGLGAVQEGVQPAAWDKIDAIGF